MISANAALPGSYDYAEVARSVLIAIAASYAALDLAGRINAARGRVRLAWLGGGATAMGIGIWTMHLKGMLAFHLPLPVPVKYHWPIVLVSLLVAILASAVTLYVASRRTMGWVEALSGSVIMSGGVAGMHYLGMASMRMPAITQYSPLLVAASILFAFIFSLVALLMAFDLRQETRWTVPRRLGSAIVMGAAVSAMHYTGMAAATFIPASPPDLSHAVNISPLANNGIAIVTLIVIGAAMVTSSVDRRAATEIQKEAEDRLRLVIDTTPALLYSARPDGYLDFFNKRWLEYLGLPLDEIIGWGWTSAIHPDDADDLVSKWRRSLATGEPYEAEARVRRADGEYRWMLHRKLPARDDSGTIIKWYGASVDIEDRRRAEDAVRRSEEYLRLVIDTIPQQIWSGPSAGFLDFCNAQWRSYTGLTQEELQGEGWQRILHPDDRERILKAWRESEAHGTPYEQEVRRRGADGQYRWFLGLGVPLKGSEGRIVRWYGTNTDIEDRKQAADLLRLVIDTTPAMIHSARPDGYLDFFNKRWLEYLGVSLDDLLGWRWTNVIHPDDLAELLDNWRTSLATGEPFEAEARLRRADGEYRLTLHRKVPLRDKAGNIVKWYGSVIDIEDRKRAEDELRKQKEVFQKVFESIPVTIAFIGVDGLLELVNPEWERTIGWTLEGIREQNLDIYTELFPDPQYRQMILDLIAASTGEWTDIKVRVRDGRVIDVAANLVHLSDGSRLGIGQDITERKRAEEALQEAQDKLARVTRIQAMGELAAAIAHEVNQPLTAIVTNANFSLRQLRGLSPNPDELREAIAEIVNDGTRASAIISRIRTLLMKGAPERSELDINEVIREVGGFLRNELTRARVSLRSDLAPDLRPVPGDRVQLQQLVLNLISNSIDAMRTVKDRPREILIKSVRHPDGVLIQVQDSGPGIDPEQADRIFEPFFTTKPEGIGMGLSISRSIVESHGGRLWAVAGSNGALFEFTLPAQD